VTSVCDAVLAGPDLDAEYAKIGSAIRGTTDKRLFVIGDSYDDRRPVLHAVFSTGHFDNWKQFKHNQLQATARHETKPERFGNASYVGFERKAIPDLFLDYFQVAFGTDVPKDFNKDRVEIVTCNPYGDCVFPPDFRPELGAVIRRSVLASLERDKKMQDAGP
jgi:hypothetical protein